MPGKPIVEGWFSDADPLALQALECETCHTRVFPPRATTCPNPACRSDGLHRVELARTGTVWSWAVNHYQPPAPYVAPDSFEPYVVLAVELDGEGLTILGQLDNPTEADRLAVGVAVEVVRGHVLAEGGGDRDMYAFRVRDTAEGEKT